MTAEIDVLKLSDEVESDSQSRDLSRELLSQGQTLYGKNSDYPELLDRTTPDGQRMLGHWNNGEFEPVVCLLV
jgi:hypothetical protein